FIIHIIISNFQIDFFSGPERLSWTKSGVNQQKLSNRTGSQRQNRKSLSTTLKKIQNISPLNRLFG
ncbi:hypothetical protein LIZ76_16565, partial [Caldibacillus sp. 210928-DFI.2.22]